MASKFLIASFVLCVLAACMSPPIVVTKVEEVNRYVGKKVTLVGEVSNSKIPQILGVDVPSADIPDLRGKLAEATGILEQVEVTDAQIREWERNGPVAHRGPGTFYLLRGETGVREKR